MTTETWRQGTSRRMMTGITMLPIVIDAPMTTVPTNSMGVEPRERMMVPIRTPMRQSGTAASGPARRMTAEAAGVTTAKRNTGSPVSSPAATEDRPMSAWMFVITGVGAMMGPRKLSATRMIPGTTHGSRARMK